MTSPNHEHPVPSLPDRTAVSRRRLLRGAAGMAGIVGLGGFTVVLSACGGDDPAPPGSAGETGGTGAPTGTADADGFVLVQRYPQTSVTPGAARLAVSLASPDGALRTTGPDTLDVTVRDESGAVVTTTTARRHGDGHAVPYWPIIVDLPAAGLYELAVAGAVGDPTPFLVFDPDDVAMPCPGDTLPPFDTPTLADARGVDPVCTRLEGPCPFHEVTLSEALASGRPVVYLIGTPAHCATATCAPGLDALIVAAERFADRAVFVHAEVYADPDATEVAEAVRAVELDYEPVLWITDAAGVVTRRVDIVWDEPELIEILEAALA